MPALLPSTVNCDSYLQSQLGLKKRWLSSTGPIHTPSDRRDGRCDEKATESSRSEMEKEKVEYCREVYLERFICPSADVTADLQLAPVTLKPHVLSRRGRVHCAEAFHCPSTDPFQK